jgi:peptidyl-tRNA hydrolase
MPQAQFQGFHIPDQVAHSPMYAKKETCNGEGQRKEIYYTEWMPAGRGKVNSSDHLCGTDMRFRFRQEKN